MSESKTPYEIRLDVLHMAKEYLDSIQNANNVLASQVFAHVADVNAKFVDQSKHAFDPIKYAAEITNNCKKFIPEQYSIEDLIQRAGELYSFIQKKQ